jgi:hypothetical protein
MSHGCRRVLVWLGLWLLGLASPVGAETVPQVTVVLSDGAPTYREVANAFVAGLAGKYPATVRVLADLTDAELAALRLPGALIVPVGVLAMRAVYDQPGREATILSLLVPRATSRVTVGAGGRDSAVYLDQSPARVLAFTRRLLPKARRIGIVASNESADGLRGYQAEAARGELELVVEWAQSSQDVGPALQRLLPRVDVLLLVPDSRVVNEASVRQILIASYRSRVPVVGFSRGLANAGAVASLVSSPAGIGGLGAQLVRQRNPATGALPPARNADQFEVVFNRQVARSLAVELPEDGQGLVDGRD